MFPKFFWIAFQFKSGDRVGIGNTYVRFDPMLHGAFSVYKMQVLLAKEGGFSSYMILHIRAVLWFEYYEALRYDIEERKDE